MYEYIKGELNYIGNNFVVIDNNGIGYRVYTSVSTFPLLPSIGKEVKLYTYLNVKEDLMELYGFITKEELDLYRLLITVSGVGPKAGISVLSALSPDKFKIAVATGDAKSIAKAQGIGAKTASRIILELKDKISLDAQISDDGESLEVINGDDPRVEAAEVLTVLGYSLSEAKKAVAGLSGTVDEMVSTALKNMKGTN
jgi:Holliday junction DNA helicase RuvA